jgi:hypothetical protein
VSAKMTAADVKEALRIRHGISSGSGEWVCIEEAFSGWTTAGGGIDLLAIGAWRTAKAAGLPGAGRDGAQNPVVAYEVKVSRADFKRELYGVKPKPKLIKPMNGESFEPYEWVDHRRERPGWPFKAAWALECSHYFMFAVPEGLLKDEEIVLRKQPHGGGLWLPPEAGLVEVTRRGCRVRIPAEKRAEPPALTRHQTAELIRHAAMPASQRAKVARVSHLEHQITELNAAIQRLNDENDALRAQVGFASAA